MTTGTAQATLLAAELAGAEERGELELHFQPEVDLLGGEVTGMEALLRWAHPGRGLLWPRDFLAVARTAGLLPGLGRWVLTRCAGELATWPAGSRLSFNVAAAELADPDYPLHLASVVAANGLPDGALCVDVTETALVTAGHHARALCTALQEAGVRVAVDDVGAVASVAGRMEGLPVDVVKLGGPLVRDIDTDPHRRADVAAMVRGAAREDRQVVAEAVQTWGEAACLVDLGVLRGQGYLFSPPQRADRARWLLARGLTRATAPSGWGGRRARPT